jgi:hypothetical protein
MIKKRCLLLKRSIFLDESKEVVLEKASCYKDVTVKKYDLLSLSSKQVEDIVDEKVKELVKERLKQFGNKEKEAFKDVLWFNEKKQIPIKTVRLFARPDANSLQPIKKDENGKDIGFVVQEIIIILQFIEIKKANKFNIHVHFGMRWKERKTSFRLLLKILHIYGIIFLNKSFLNHF